jgi:hypothetical protein
VVDRFPPGWEPIPEPDVDLLLSFILGGATSRPNVKQYHLAYLYHVRLSRTLELTEALRGFDQALNLGIAERAPARIFVHAGVVGWRGHAIVIPGRSHSGKSRLVAALVAAGAQYYSDEYAVLDERGRVHPFARPLSIRQPDNAPPRHARAEDLGGRTGTRPVPVGLVLDTACRAGTTWRPRRLSAGAGVLALLDHTIPARRRPKAVLRTLRTISESAAIFKGARGEADDVARRVLERCERAAAS